MQCGGVFGLFLSRETSGFFTDCGCVEFNVSTQSQTVAYTYYPRLDKYKRHNKSQLAQEKLPSDKLFATFDVARVRCIICEPQQNQILL